MDRQKMLRQAQILRRKRVSRTSNAKPRLKEGIIKLDKPLPNPTMQQFAVNSAEIRRQKAEKLLKQRQEELKNTEQQKEAIKKQAEIQKARAAAAGGGCNRCRRKRGQG